MDIAHSHYIIDIRLMGLGGKRIPKENDQIDLIVLDLRADLLGATKMTCQIFMDREIRHLFDEPTCSTCGIELILT